MSDPIYFVVLKGPKGIYATKYHDQLPTHFPDSAIYRLRLDRLDDAERWAEMSLDKLLGIYSQMKAAGKLPAFLLAFHVTDSSNYPSDMGNLPPHWGHRQYG